MSLRVNGSCKRKLKVDGSTDGLKTRLMARRDLQCSCQKTIIATEACLLLLHRCRTRIDKEDR
jgi:hypothetical protein